MPDLSALSDDAIVAEMQRRLDRGSLGYEGLLSTDQAHWRDCWHALVSVVSSCRNRYPDEFGTRLILDKVHELIDHGGPKARAFAINSTFYGVDRPEEHQRRVG